jgi:hypothetical protein
MNPMKSLWLLYTLLLCFSSALLQAQSIREVAVQKGWNLLGSDLSSWQTSQLSSARVNIVWTYDSGTWRAFSPHNAITVSLAESGVPPLEEISSGAGFLLHTSQDSLLVLTGEAATTIKTLVFTSIGASTWQLLSHPFTQVQLTGQPLPEDSKIWVYRQETWNCFDSSTATTSQTGPTVLRPNEGFFLQLPANEVLMMRNSFEPNPENPLLGIRLSGSQIWGVDLGPSGDQKNLIDLNAWTVSDAKTTGDNFLRWFLKKGYSTLLFKIIDPNGCVYVQDPELENAGLDCLRYSNGALQTLVEKLHENHRFILGDLSTASNQGLSLSSTDLFISLAGTLITSYNLDGILSAPRNDAVSTALESLSLNSGKPNFFLADHRLRDSDPAMVYENPFSQDSLHHHPYARRTGFDQSIFRPISLTLTAFSTHPVLETAALNRHLFRTLRDSPSGHFFDPCPWERSLEICAESEASLHSFEAQPWMLKIRNLGSNTKDSRSLGNIVISATNAPWLSSLSSRALNQALELLEASGFQSVVTTQSFHPLAEAYVLILEGSSIPQGITPMLETSKPLLIQVINDPSEPFPPTLVQALGLLQPPTVQTQALPPTASYQSQNLSFQKSSYTSEETCWALPAEHLGSSVFAPLGTTNQGRELALLVQNGNLLWTACVALDEELFFVLRAILDLPGGISKPTHSLFFNAPKAGILALDPVQNLAFIPEFHSGNILANHYPTQQDIIPVILKPQTLERVQYPLVLETGDLIILEPNHIPTAKAGSNRVILPLSMVRLTGLGLDQDLDVLSYHWRQNQGPNIVLINAKEQSVEFQSPAKTNLDQEIILGLQVSDGKSSSEEDFLRLTLAANQPPQVTLAEGLTVTGGAGVQISALGSDPDMDSIQYHWQQVLGPSVNLSSTTIPSPEFIAPPKTNNSQTLMFSVFVEDGLSSSAKATVSVEIKANQSPQVFVDNPVQATGNRPFSLHASSFDPDQEPLEYIWRQISGTTVTLDISNPATPSSQGPDSTTSSELVFGVRVYDGLRLSNEKNITVFVEATQLPTCINSGVEICIE